MPKTHIPALGRLTLLITLQGKYIYNVRYKNNILSVFTTLFQFYCVSGITAILCLWSCQGNDAEIVKHGLLFSTAKLAAQSTAFWDEPQIISLIFRITRQGLAQINSQRPFTQLTVLSGHGPGRILPAFHNNSPYVLSAH